MAVREVSLLDQIEAKENVHAKNNYDKPDVHLFPKSLVLRSVDHSALDFSSSSTSVLICLADETCWRLRVPYPHRVLLGGQEFLRGQSIEYVSVTCLDEDDDVVEEEMQRFCLDDANDVTFYRIVFWPVNEELRSQMQVMDVTVALLGGDGDVYCSDL